MPSFAVSITNCKRSNSILRSSSSNNFFCSRSLTPCSSLSASAFLRSIDNSDSLSLWRFVSSINSLFNAKSFARFSERNPSTCANTPSRFAKASVSAIRVSVVLFLSYSSFAALTCKFACANIAFSCFSKTKRSSSFAFILTAMLFLSSSLICLCCSACRS